VVHQIDDLAAGAVHRQRDRVRVGGEVALHLPGGRHVDFDFVQVVLVGPGGVTGGAPHALGSCRHADGGVRAGDGGGGVIEDVQCDGAGGGGPDPQSGDAAAEGYAQVAVVEVQVVQHPGDLELGGVHHDAVCVHGDDGDLALE